MKHSGARGDSSGGGWWYARKRGKGGLEVGKERLAFEYGVGRECRRVLVSGVEECARRDGKVVGKVCEVCVLWRRLKWKSQVAQEEWCGVVQGDMVGGTDSKRRRDGEQFEMSSKTWGRWLNGRAEARGTMSVPVPEPVPQVSK